MNYNQLLLALALLIIGVSCEPNVLFKQPLPPDVEAISKIPLDYQGAYLCDSDSTLVHITETAAYKEDYYTIVFPVNKVLESENCAIVAGGLYLPGRQECIPFSYINEDTIMATVYDLDTIFSVDMGVIKSYKDRLFVNVKNKDGGWITFMITPQKYGDLLWEMIDVPDEINHLQQITEDIKPILSKDKEKYIINPTIKEFEKILEKEYFLACDYLRPVKPIRMVY